MKLNSICIAILLFIATVSGVCFAQDYNYFGDSETVINDKCQKDWPDDYKMQEFCIKGQREAVEELSYGAPQDISYDVFLKIRNKCGADWPYDYKMRRFCEKGQYDSWRKLNR